MHSFYFCVITKKWCSKLSTLHNAANWSIYDGVNYPRKLTREGRKPVAHNKGHVLLVYLTCACVRGGAHSAPIGVTPVTSTLQLPIYRAAKPSPEPTNFAEPFRHQGGFWKGLVTWEHGLILRAHSWGAFPSHGHFCAKQKNADQKAGREMTMTSDRSSCTLHI